MIDTFVRRRWAMLTAACCVISPAFAVETRFWQQGDFADFSQGTLKNLSLRSDGRLTLGPVVKELFDTSTPYLWAAAQDSKGNLYAGGGGPTGSTARLFQIDPSGKTKTLADLEGLEIHAIAVDRSDRVYAATAPDGKVYRIATGGKPELFFDPKTKYIWAMAFGSNGDLFVATGDRGEVFRVAPDGKGSVFFRTEETHARSLAIDAQDNLLIGTEPSGLVLRVSPKAEGFVLYQANRREVTAVAVARDGSVYAAAVGTRPTGSPASGAATPQSPAISPTPAPAQSPGAPGAAKPIITVAPPPSFTPSGPSVSGGSEVYRISPDGSPRRVWQNSQDIVYALAFDAAGRPVIGTGNKGNIYRLDSDLTYTLLENLSPTQVTAFSAGRDGRIYAVTGNVGKVFQVGPGIETKGTYESEVFDAGAFSYWGRLIFKALPANGMSFDARSGNVNHPQKNWSPWSALQISGDGGRIAAPPSRFLQYRATLTGSGAAAPELVSVDLAYMPKNLAPVVEQIELTPANYRFSTPALALGATTTGNNITLPPIGQRKKAGSAIDLSSASSQSMSYAKGSMGARWAAMDENGDSLLYTVDIKGVNENDWKLLKDKVRDRYLSFDSTAFPDGEYVIRVTATDAPGNPPDQALTASLVSDPFLIDNTPAVIAGLAGSASGNKLNVTWRARDALSIIDKAEYSVNGGDWIVVEPTTRLSDAPELEYRLTVERAAPRETTVAVRVTDEYDNQTVQKVVIR